MSNQWSSSYFTEAAIETNGSLTADRKMTFSAGRRYVLIIFAAINTATFHD